MTDSVRSTNDLKLTDIVCPYSSQLWAWWCPLPIPHPVPAVITASFCNRSIVSRHWFATLPAVLQMLWTPAALLSPSLELFSCLRTYWMRTKLLVLSYEQSSLAFRVLCYLWLRNLFTTDSISQHAHHHVHLSASVCVFKGITETGCSQSPNYRCYQDLTNVGGFWEVKAESRRRNADF